MHFADYHTHTHISVDGHETAAAMVMAAQQAGMAEICLTDHCDTVDWDELLLTDRGFGVLSEIKAEILKLPPANITVKTGIELGDAHLHPDRARELAADPQLDFIIGSVHILRVEGDFYKIKYQSIEECYVLMDHYLDQCIETANLNLLDVMGHIGYCYRYMAAYGLHPRLDLSRYGDKIQALLKILIENGRGIEVNTSGVRSGVGAFPDDHILGLYKDMGGEIITVGSDAHYTKDVGFGVAEEYDHLKQLGFKYVALFNKRKPEFIKL